MKKVSLKIFSAVLIFALITNAASASAIDMISVKASRYLTTYSANMESSGNGSLVINFKALATSSMTQIGANCIVVQELRNSQWYGVKTYYASTTSGMLASNAVSQNGSVTFYGASGVTYRAIVTIYASNSSGSDSRSVTTGSVTA